MFESDLLERFSRIHPATPFVAWVPVVSLFLARSVWRGDIGVLAIAGLFVSGTFAWSLAEYVLHRWVFHWEGTSPAAKRIHFLLHGVHHDYPNDKDRLVMPLGASIPLAVFFYGLFYVAFGGVRLAEPFFAGFVVGYLIYDGSHYAMHHFRLESRLARAIKRHHMLHHHADNHGGFGVSSPLWDYVFRTEPKVARLRDAARR